jgi:long-chain fatty acid transport protein
MRREPTRGTRGDDPRSESLSRDARTVGAPGASRPDSLASRGLAGAGALAMAALLVALAPPARGAGYAIYEQGSKALGMAGAFTAVADDPSAIFFNPAGLARLEGTRVQAGLHVIAISREFAGTSPYPGFGVTEDADDELGTPINLYVSRRLSPALAAGIGVNNPFGLKTAWEDPEAFTGRFINREAGITPFFVTGILAWNAGDRVSVGAGPIFVTSSVNLQRNVGVANPFYGDSRFPGARQLLDVGRVELDGEGTDWGWTAGARIDLTERVHVGATYRAGVEIDYEGDADFTYQFDGSGNAALDVLLGQALPGQFPLDQGADVLLPFPATAAVGLAFDAGDSWTAALDIVWTDWSRVETVGLNFEDESLGTLIEEDWHDAVALRMGVEWRVSDRWALRGGWYFDQSPMPTKSIDPLLPDSDRVGLSFGAGLQSGAWTFDAYGLGLIVEDRSTRGRSLRGYDGTYASGALVGGLNVTLAIGGGDR